MELRHRLATRDDLPSFEPLVTRAIDDLQRDFLSPEQIAASHAVMGIDTQPTEPARIQAMYTHPDFVRRGVGRRILELCEEAATRKGFTRLSLMGTMSGQPLYRAYGFQVVENVDIGSEISIPAVQMVKDIG